MKKLIKASLFSALSLLAFVTANVTVHAEEPAYKDMYRMYNPNSGEHFYTGATLERNSLVSAGWKYEGLAWYAPLEGNPVYRVYNPNTGDHHYTLSGGEKASLVANGWRDEGIGWYSDRNKGVPIYRSFNPNAKVGSHNFTAALGEHNHLVANGWKNEGEAWYGLKGISNKEFNNPLEAKELFVLSRYGKREDPTGKSGTQHDGLDLFAEKDDKILAARYGTVVDVGNHYSAGNYVVVQHDNGYYTYYYHMTKSIVQKGQQVQTGQQIGTVGDTGYATGPHLHIGISKKLWKDYVDPEPFFERFISTDSDSFFSLFYN